jgi:uncharacterized repeat protein (TIGR03803 family)
MKMIRFAGLALICALATTMHAQSYKILYNLGNKAGDPSRPSSAGIIAQSRGGNMFSTSGLGGTHNLGSAFYITTGGSLKVLHSFDGADGQDSASGLTLATDGQYYGTTRQGGTYGYGTIFKMTQNGIVTTLYSFHGGADGAYPTAPPIQSVGGDFYGVTEGQGATYFGSVYKITRYGDFTLLHTFPSTGADGEEPAGPLVQGTDYFFYGTATNRGAHGAGTIFRVSSTGDFKVVFNFDGAHGALPVSGLIQANDGNYYGVAFEGGTNGTGTVFKMTPAYAVRVLHNFDATENSGFANGGLVQATDGNLYGTDAYNLFRITTGGTFTVLHPFTYSTGASPYDTLIQHTNGVLYGMTLQGGGGANNGVFYSLTAGLKPFVTYLPIYGRVGTSVQILGQGFTADSIVSFNGVPATVSDVSPTYLRAIVPGGATSGWITVTTSKGTLQSNKKFLIHP